MTIKVKNVASIFSGKNIKREMAETIAQEAATFTGKDYNAVIEELEKAGNLNRVRRGKDKGKPLVKDIIAGFQDDVNQYSEFLADHGIGFSLKNAQSGALRDEINKAKSKTSFSQREARESEVLNAADETINQAIERQRQAREVEISNAVDSTAERQREINESINQRKIEAEKARQREKTSSQSGFSRKVPVTEARVSEGEQTTSLAVIQEDSIGAAKAEAEAKIKNASDKQKIENEIYKKGMMPVYDDDGNLVGTRYAQSREEKKDIRNKKKDIRYQEKANAAQQHAQEEFERIKKSALGAGTPEDVASNIAQTGALDNSGGLPTWGKIGIGVAGGLVAGSLLDGE